MKQDETSPPLDDRKIADIYPIFRADLMAAFNPAETAGVLGIFKSAIGVAQSIYTAAGQLRSTEGGPSRPNPLLTAQNAELGLLLINEIPEYRDTEDIWTNMDSISYNSRRYNRIEELLGTAEWDNERNYDLLVYFLGTEKAACARYAWKRLRHQVYQRGNLRRLFRSPNNREIYLRNQINFIIRIIPQAYTRKFDANHRPVFTFYDLSLAEQIKYNRLLGDENTDLFYLWSAGLDMWNAPVFRQLEEILSGKDRDSRITVSILKALVCSERQDAWVLVEKLLFASRLQKKMQYTIQEALNETSPGAIKYLLRVIVDKQLSRLSLIVRAVDGWIGLGWENELETTVRSFLGKGLLYLENPDAIPAAIKMDNNAIVYMALWAQGVLDVEETLPYLRELYKKGDAHKRALSLLFAEQTAHYKIQMPLFLDALEDKDLPPLAYAVNFFTDSVNHGHNDKYYNKIYPELFGRLECIYRDIPVREQSIDGFLFPWMKLHFSKKKVFQTMICLAGDQPDKLRSILSFFGGLEPKARKELIGLLLNQKDSAIIPLIGQLVMGGNEEQRLIGLDILKQLKKSGRLAHECEIWTGSFEKRNSISPEEDKSLRALRRIQADNTNVVPMPGRD